MTTATGSWVKVIGPGGFPRQDWVPAEQPASPDGSEGRWHVVSADGKDAWWEWHPAPVAPPPPVAPAAKPRPRVPQDLTSNIRRGAIAALAIGVLMPWATLGPFSITGTTSADGKLLMAVAAGGLVVSLSPRWLLVRFVDIALAISALLASIIDMGNTSVLASKVPGALDVQVGSGLIVCVIASGAWLASLMWEQRQMLGRRRRARRERYTPPAWYQPAH